MSRPRQARVGKRPTPEPTATTTVVDDEMVIYCERTQRMHCLDHSASLVWALCDGSRDVDAIVTEAAAVAGLSPEEVRGDVEATLAQFRDLGITR